MLIYKPQLHNKVCQPTREAVVECGVLGRGEGNEDEWHLRLRSLLRTQREIILGQAVQVITARTYIHICTHTHVHTYTFTLGLHQYTNTN